MTMDELLSAGVAAARAGDPARARELLAKAVTANPQSEEAWLQLGLVLEERDRREYCFRKVLALNPQNHQVQRLLAIGSGGLPASATESEERQSPPDSEPLAPMPDASPTSPVASSSSPTEPPIQTELATPAPLPATKSAPEPTLGGIEKILIALLGVASGLLLCGGPILYVVQSGRVDPLLPVALVPPFVPTSTPILPTGTPTRTGTPLPPTSIPSSTPTLTKQDKANAAAADYERAEALMAQQNFAQAIPMWDRVIGAGTDNSKPYIRRAIAYFALVSNQRTMGESVDYLDKALADTDKAIALAPSTGDYYVVRFMVYYALAGTEYFRVDRDRLYELALENLKTALALGSTQGASELDVATLDLALGRCDDSIAIVSRVLAAAKRTTSPDANTATLLSEGYLCKGKLDDALKYIDSAIKQEPGTHRTFVRAIILINMGRLNDALAQLNQMIEASPHYAGTRYYLRALIYYDLKKPDLAQADLAAGAAQTWSRYDLRSYVLGRMALDAGDKKTGTEQLLLAEATLSHEYGAIFDRVRRDAKQLNVPLLVPTLAIPFKATPIVIPKATAAPTKANSKLP